MTESSPEIALRPLREADLARLELSLRSSPCGSHAEDVAWQDEGGGNVLIAWMGERPVGSGLIRWAGPRDPAVERMLPNCPEIFRLGVAEDARSRGAGTALLRGLEELAWVRGFRRVGLGVGLGNEGARRLYDRLGYRSAGTPSYVDRWEEPRPDGTRRIEEEGCQFLVKEHAADVRGVGVSKKPR